MFDLVLCTKIGSPYAIDTFENLLSKYQRVAFFEANGGFLLRSFLQFDNGLLKALPRRDAMLIVLAYAGNNTISNLVSKLPKSFIVSDRLRDFSKARSSAIIELTENNP